MLLWISILRSPVTWQCDIIQCTVIFSQEKAESSPHATTHVFRSTAFYVVPNMRCECILKMLQCIMHRNAMHWTAAWNCTGGLLHCSSIHYISAQCTILHLLLLALEVTNYFITSFVVINVSCADTDICHLLTFNSEKPTLLNLFVKFFVLCQIWIHFCQSAKAMKHWSFWANQTAFQVSHPLRVG